MRLAAYRPDGSRVRRGDVITELARVPRFTGPLQLVGVSSASAGASARVRFYCEGRHRQALAHEFGLTVREVKPLPSADPAHRNGEAMLRLALFHPTLSLSAVQGGGYVLSDPEGRYLIVRDRGQGSALGWRYVIVGRPQGRRLGTVARGDTLADVVTRGAVALGL